MWPKLGSSLISIKIDKGQAQVGSISRAEWVGAPRFSVANGSFQWIRANSVEIRCGFRHLAGMALHDTGALTGSMAEVSWATITVHEQSSEAYEATFADGSSNTLRVRVEAVVGPGGSPDHISCTLVSASVGQANKTLGGWILPTLRMLPFAATGTEDLQSLVPILTGQGNHTPTLPSVSGDYGTVYPAYDITGGLRYNRAVRGVVPTLASGSLQYMHLLDRKSFAGVMLVACDPGAYFKTLVSNGDNEHVIYRVLHTPPNGRARTTLDSTNPAGSYETRIIPMLGGSYDSAQEYRRIVINELKPSWLPTRTIEDDAWQAITAGWGWQRAGILADSIWMWLAISFGPKVGAETGTTEAQQVAQLQASITRLIAELGDSPDVTLIYGASDIDLLTLEQDQWTNYGEALFTFASNLGSQVIRYWLPQGFSIDTTWYDTPQSVNAQLGYKDSLGDPDSYTAEDAAGVAIVNSDNAVDDRSMPQLGQANARAHIVDLMNRRFLVGDIPNGVQPTPGIDGFYLDALTAVVAVEDYRSDLDPEQRGFSPYYILGVASLIREMQIEGKTRLNQLDFGLMSEWPAEITGHALDGVSADNGPTRGQTDRFVPMQTGQFEDVWGDYIPLTNFYDGWVVTGQPEGVLIPPDPSFSQEFTINAMLHSLAAGKTIMVSPTFFGRADMVPVDKGNQADASVVQWNSWMERMVRVMRNAFTKLRATGAKRAHNGRRLRTLRGTFQEALETRHVEFLATGWAAPRVHGRAWLNQRPETRIWVILHNGEFADATFRLRMDRDRYPEMPSGRLELVELTNSLLPATRLTTFEDVLDITLTIPVDDTRVLQIRRLLES